MEGLKPQDFYKLCQGSAFSEGISRMYIPEVVEALEAAVLGDDRIIWIQGSACTGCMATLLNSLHPKLRNVLMDIFGLNHPEASKAPNGRVEYLYEVAKKHSGNYLLVVEGAIPTGAEGKFCWVGEDQAGGKVTLLELVKKLSAQAKAIIPIGTCAAFGGRAAAAPNPTGCVGVGELIQHESIINLPGCPPHPDWIIGTLTHFLLYGKPELDAEGRPLLFYPAPVHQKCPRKKFYDKKVFAPAIGEQGCLLYQGCKGVKTKCDSTARKWEPEPAKCLSAGLPCNGCVNSSYGEEVISLQEQSYLEESTISLLAKVVGGGRGEK